MPRDRTGTTANREGARIRQVEMAAKQAAVTAVRQAVRESDIDLTPMSDEELAEAQVLANDAKLWATELPDARTEGRFYRNQGLRMLRGISRDAIEKATIRDRVTSAKACFEMGQLCLDQPTANISFSERRNVADALPALMAEIDRRKREADTIEAESADITDAIDVEAEAT